MSDPQNNAGTPVMTTRSGKIVGKSIRKTLFNSTRRPLPLSAAKRRKVSSTDVNRKRKISNGSPQPSNKKKGIVSPDELMVSLQKMLEEAEARQTKTLMAAMDKKHEEYLREFKKTVSTLKKEQKDFMKEQRDKITKIEDKQKRTETTVTNMEQTQISQENTIKKIDKELKQVNSKMQSTKNELEKSLEKKKLLIQAEIVDTKELLKKSQDKAKDCRTNIHERIDLCVGRVSALEENLEGNSPTKNHKYPVKSTAVAKFVKQPEGIDPQQIAELIVHEALELPDTRVVRAMSMSRNDKLIGTMKIQLESADDLKDVLDAKAKLRQFDDDPEMKNVKIRQSKTQEQLVAEQNSDAMLKALDLYGDFFRTDKGFLLPRNQQRKRSEGEYSQRGRGGRFNRNRQQSQQVNPSGQRRSNDTTRERRPARRKLSEAAKKLMNQESNASGAQSSTDVGARKKKQDSDSTNP